MIFCKEFQKKYRQETPETALCKLFPPSLIPCWNMVMDRQNLDLV